jgi:hypothetical protein
MDVEFFESPNRNIDRVPIKYPDQLSSHPVRSLILRPQEGLLIAYQFRVRRVSLSNRAREISDIVNVHRSKVKSLEVLEHKHVIRFLLKDRLPLKEMPIGSER